MKAIFIRDYGLRTDGRIYRMEPPLDGHDHVWVSAVFVPFTGPETYIFGWDEGVKDVASWGELEGSYRGGLDHDEALRGAGYEPVYP